MLTTILVLCLAVVFLFAVVIWSLVPNFLTRVLRVYSIHRLPTSRFVALTFDDGPDEKYTGLLLDELRRLDIRATFFVVAQKAVSRPHLIERMRQEGHDIQIHGYTHRFMPACGPGHTRRQIVTSAKVLRSNFGVQTSVYRPTWGVCNLGAFSALRGLRHKMVIWSVMVGDWKVTPAEILLDRIDRKLQSGSIIVLHDSDETAGSEKGAPAEVIRLMPLLADLVRHRGYEFTTVSEWL